MGSKKHIHKLHTQIEKFINVHIATWTWWWRNHPAWCSYLEQIAYRCILQSQEAFGPWPPKYIWLLPPILTIVHKGRTTVEWTWWRHRNEI